MLKFEIILGEIVEVTCNMARDFLGVPIIGQIGMIHKNLDWKSCASKEMAPVIKAINKTHKLPIPNIIIPFGCSQGARGGSQHELLSLRIPLEKGSTQGVSRCIGV
jgi:hypothetical protein